MPLFSFVVVFFGMVGVGRGGRSEHRVGHLLDDAAHGALSHVVPLADEGQVRGGDGRTVTHDKDAACTYSSLSSFSWNSNLENERGFLRRLAALDGRR